MARTSGAGLKPSKRRDASPTTPVETPTVAPSSRAENKSPVWENTPFQCWKPTPKTVIPQCWKPPLPVQCWKPPLPLDIRVGPACASTAQRLLPPARQRRPMAREQKHRSGDRLATGDVALLVTVARRHCDRCERETKTRDFDARLCKRSGDAG